MRPERVTLLAFLAAGCGQENLVQEEPLLEVSVYTQGQSYAAYDDTSLSVDLGEVPVHASSTAYFLVHNVGDLEVDLTSLRYVVAGSDWRSPQILALRPADFDTALPVRIEPSHQVLIELSYWPKREAQEPATAVLTTSAGNYAFTVQAHSFFYGAPDLEVAFQGWRGPAAGDCRDLNSDGRTDGCYVSAALDLGSVATGQSATQELIIRNAATCAPLADVDACSLCSLTIARDATRQGMGWGFKAGTNVAGLFTVVGARPLPVDIPQESAGCPQPHEVRLLLSFAAADDVGDHDSVFVIESSDPDEPLIEIPVRAAARTPPVCIAQFRAPDPADPDAP
ncbi:MAG: hypothetical protein HYZ27_00445, partial [Deltaproteobacteria bacterium]|nr:hypothetical protein [Deltaproteobacteria bacterium]